MKIYHRYVDLYFTTATILEWKHLLKPDGLKDLVIESLRFLVREQRAVVYAFVIMPNHIHVVWHIQEPYTIQGVRGALLSFTGHQFKKYLIENAPKVLGKFKVDLKDRMYQFWERNALSITIHQEEVYLQKVRYVHENPCAAHWKLANSPEQYKYSSAYPNETGHCFWDFVAADR